MNPSLEQLVETLLCVTNDESTDSGGTTLDHNYTIYDIDKDSLAELHRRFQVFVAKAEAAITEVAGDEWTSIDDFYIGAGRSSYHLEHDYIMTVNEAGCGFWEKYDWQPEVGSILTDLAKESPPISVTIGDDSKLYLNFI